MGDRLRHSSTVEADDPGGRPTEGRRRRLRSEGEDGVGLDGPGGELVHG
ncbi:hypothetical protein [Ornithinimicrobium kibberense]